MCAREDFGVDEVMKAANGCKCENRWCEMPDEERKRRVSVFVRRRKAFRNAPILPPQPGEVVRYRIEDIVRAQAEPGEVESSD